MTKHSPPLLPAVAVPPGRGVRFALGCPDGRRSATWITWTSRNHADLYVAPRMIAPRFKISLHHSGSWQYGLTEEEAVRRAVLGRRRHFEVWSRPEDTGPGLARSLSVVIPDVELRPWPADHPQPGKAIVTIPCPGDSTAARIDFIHVATSAPPLIQFQEPIVYVAELAISDGNTVRVVARRIPWSSANQRAVEEYKTRVREDLDTQNQHYLRLAVPFALADGTRCFVETALDLS